MSEVLESDNVQVGSDLEDVNSRFAIEKLSDDDIIKFNIVICDNDVDRSEEVFSAEALNEIVECINNKQDGVPFIKNHDSSDVENIIGRITKAHLVEEDNKFNSFGEKYKYVLGNAYALKDGSSYVDKILGGIWRGASICSLNQYENIGKYNMIVHVDDVLEVSCVGVACQPKATIRNKSFEDGGSFMKKAQMLMQKVLKSKAMPEELKDELQIAIETPEDAEVSAEDVEKLVEENIELKAKIEELEAEIEALKGEAEESKVCGAIEKAVEELDPLTEQVKADILEKIDTDKVCIGEDGKICGLEEQLEEIKKSYAGLFKTKEIKVKTPEVEKETKKGFNPVLTVGKKAETKKSFIDSVHFN